MKMSDYIPEVEEQTGRPVSPSVIRFAKGMDRICEKVERMGKDDADKGDPACAAEAFREWAARGLCDEHPLVDVIADFVYKAYLTGYYGKEVAV